MLKISKLFVLSVALLLCNTSSAALKADFTYAINCRNITFTNQSTGMGSSDLQYYYVIYKDNQHYRGYSAPDGTIEVENGNYRVCLQVREFDQANNIYYDSSEIINITIQCNVMGGSQCDTNNRFEKSGFGSFKYEVDPGDCKKILFSKLWPDALQVSWRFGDSITFGTGVTQSTKYNPVHTYPSSGIYNTTLRVQGFDSLNNRYCWDTFDIKVKVTCDSCTVRASLTLDATAPYQAEINNYSSGKFNKHYWDFGDGKTSSQLAPTHVYTITGPIKVKYIVSDSLTGCADTAELAFEIDANGNLKRGAFTMRVFNKTNQQWNSALNSFETNSRFTVYPNPFRDQIEIKGPASGEITHLAIYDVMGKELLIRYTTDNEHINIQMDDVVSGIYFLKITGATGVTIHKLQKL